MTVSCICINGQLIQKLDVDIKEVVRENSGEERGFQDILKKEKALGKGVSILDVCTGMADGKEIERYEEE